MTPPSAPTAAHPRRLPAAALACLLYPISLYAADSAPTVAAFPFAGQTLTVPAGFTVELVAGPPLVNRPISVAFDERGRLYATDSSGLSERAQRQFEEKPHRVVRLEDTDGDGRYDRSTVFAERMMFPQGALFHDGSLYVAAPPHIWKLTDTDDDGVADQREVWWDGKTLTGCANDVHGPYLGPDGWFYWTKGAFAEQHHTLGNGRPFVTRAAHIYRARPDGTGFEPVLTGGMDNPVGVTFTPAGERILCGTFFQIPAAGRRDGLIHAIYGGVYGKENPAAAGHPRTGDLLPIMTHMGAAAPCGITTYRSEAFGPDYTDNVFVCYFNLRKVVRHTLVPSGATFVTRESDFLTSDRPDFRPTDVLEDADGSLLVVDTGGWYKICCPTSQLAKPDILGGIYRIRRTGAPRPRDPRGATLAPDTLSAPELAKLLADPRPDVRDRATQRLGRLGAAAVPALAAIAASGPPAARRHAVWTLARIAGDPARAAVRSALADSDATVVLAAAHTVSLWRDREAMGPLARLLETGSPLHRRLAAEALGRVGDGRAIEWLLRAATQLPPSPTSATGSPEDPAVRALDHALAYALIEIGQAEPLLRALGPGADPRRVRLALLALDQMGAATFTAAQVVSWLDHAAPAVRGTAGWIISHRPDWGAALAGHFTRRLDAPPGGAAELSQLQAQLAELSRAPAIQDLLATATDRANPTIRLLALRAMAASGLKETPKAWLDALARAADTRQPETVRQVVAAARLLPLPKGGHPALLAALGRSGQDASLPVELRLEALALGSGSLGAVDTALFTFLCASLEARHPLMVRRAAAAALARAPLAAAQRLALTDQLRTADAMAAPLLLPAFERGASAELGLRLVAALEVSPGRSGLRADLLRPLFAKYPATLGPRVSALLAGLNADAARQQARLEALVPGLAQGDVRRGQELFTSARTACTLCHKVGYGGGLLGPDLTAIGRIRSERELLEAVMYPSATLVRGYEPFTATTRAGESHRGIVRQDTPDELVLATGPASEAHLPRADVVDLQPDATSLMPPGMDVILTPAELADLVAFLKSRV